MNCSLSIVNCESSVSSSTGADDLLSPFSIDIWQLLLDYATVVNIAIAFSVAFISVMLFIIYKIFNNDLPRAQKKLRKSFNSPASEWSGMISLLSSTIFAVNSPITLTAEIEFNQQKDLQEALTNNHSIKIENTSVGNNDGTIQLSEKKGEELVLYASEDIKFTSSGTSKLTYDIEPATGHIDLVDIGGVDAHLSYETNKYVLLLSIVALILAAMSLIVGMISLGS